MKPYYEHAGITIYHGDCREILPSLSGEFYCFTDPIYNVGKDYGTCKDNLPDGEYLEFCSQWISAVKRICPHTTIYVPTKWLLEFWVNLGKEFRQVVMTWTTNTGALRGNWIQQHASLLTNCSPSVPTSDWWNNPQARRMGYFFRENDYAHPGYTSEDITRRALLIGPPDLPVLDVQCGSGTTLKIAKNLGRVAVGIEVDEQWCEIAAKRLSQEVLDFEAVNV